MPEAEAHLALAPGLHVVATPIGNMGDFSRRAAATLAACDLVACEDTRVTAKLLQRYGIRTPMLAYHEHNADRMRPVLMRRLAEGGRVGLVSDAGTPLVSDPGYKLVRDVIAEGLKLHVVPGPSAVLAALILAGLPSDRFLFAGFLDSRTTARRRSLGEFTQLRATLVFYEAAPRLADSLADMADILGDRPAAVLREITKLHEEAHRASLRELARHYRAAGPPRGEIVIVVGPPLPEVPAEADRIDAALAAALARLSLRDAATEVAETLNLPRREIYARALELARAAEGDGSE